jgi:multicopper oxidase
MHLRVLSTAIIFVLVPVGGLAQTGAGNINPCPRFVPGSAIRNPPDLFSQNGVLTVDLSYNSARDSAGRALFCFTTPDGEESPTLHVYPGDHLIVNVKNNLPAAAPAGAMQMTTSASEVCGDATMESASVNLHFHGTNTSPSCHQDEVIHTLINPGHTFTYDVAFPADEPPGLYWYHPHVHGSAEVAVQGGASGAIIVEGRRIAGAGLGHPRPERGRQPQSRRPG